MTTYLSNNTTHQNTDINDKMTQQNLNISDKMTQQKVELSDNMTQQKSNPSASSILLSAISIHRSSNYSASMIHQKQQSTNKTTRVSFCYNNN